MEGGARNGRRPKSGGLMEAPEASSKVATPSIRDCVGDRLQGEFRPIGAEVRNDEFAVP